MIHQAFAAARPSADLDPGSGSGNVIRFPRRPATPATTPLTAPVAAPAPSCGDAVLALRQAGGALAAAFALLDSNARALEDNCRALDATADAIAAHADAMARRTGALGESIRAFRSQLVALTTA